MLATSTEFQQNVGFYLREAEKGKVIRIRKLKPVQSTFKLVLEKGYSAEDTRQTRNQKIQNLIRNLNIRNTTESGLEFQNRVRN